MHHCWQSYIGINPIFGVDSSGGKRQVVKAWSNKNITHTMPWTHTTPINLLLALEDEHLPQIYLTLQEGRRARLSFLHHQSPSALQGIQLLSLNKAVQWPDLTGGGRNKEHPSRRSVSWPNLPWVGERKAGGGWRWDLEGEGDVQQHDPGWMQC